MLSVNALQRADFLELESSSSWSSDLSPLSCFLPSGGVPVLSAQAAPWSPAPLVFSQSPSMVPGAMMAGQPSGFSQPIVFTTSPSVPGWNQPSSFAVSVSSPPPVAWGTSASITPNTWSANSPLGNPFQSNVFSSSCCVHPAPFYALLSPGHSSSTTSQNWPSKGCPQ